MAQSSSKYAPIQGDLKGWQKLAHDCAQGAIYDSNERQPHSKCLPGTRVSILQSLRTLVEDSSRKIVWMAGESGSGKTTIAHTLADELRAEGKLAGTFFFSRKHAKRSTFDHVLLTLAYQLGLQHPRAHEMIMKAIFDDPALLSQEKSRYDQLEKLIIEPLRLLAQIWGNHLGMSLILDALDEGTTRGLHHTEPFISLLARLVRDTTLPIHNIIISSRSWSQIDAVMRSSALADVMRIVRLEEHDSRGDVDLFLRDAFDRMYDAHEISHFCPKSWPPLHDFTMLAQRAKGRFIFAATIIRMINQDQPHERLSLVCSMLRGDVEHVWGNIDHLYASIIDSVEASTRDTALRYITFLVNLAEPLPLSDLRLLFSVDIYPLLLPFSALISIPPSDSRDAVQIFHSTFRDFLHDHGQTEDSQVSTNRIHHPLAIRCFRTMARMLKRDICGLHNPSLLQLEIPDFSHRRDAIPRALRYACLHWLHHLELSFLDTEIQGCLLELLEQRLLFLVETCAVLGELDAAVKLLRSARKHVMEWPSSSFPQVENALALLYDSWRMTIEFFDPISLSALHVYESALPCSPAKSLLRLTYEGLLTEVTSFRFEEGLNDHWDSVTRVIDMKTSNFVLALSPDSSQVVAMCQVADHSRK